MIKNTEAEPSSDLKAEGESLISSRFIFLDFIRAAAVLVVIYAHSFAGFSEKQGDTFRSVQILREGINGPLGIIQDFGWFGVVLFFLTSGFIISHVSLKEGFLEFVIKRVFRIFPLLSVVMAIEFSRRWFFGEAVHLGDFLRSITLVNYINVPQVIYVGVAWTLIIEIMFYAMVTLTLGLRAAHITVVVNLVIVATSIFLSHKFGESFFLFAASCGYVPIILAGQVIYFGVVARIFSFKSTLVYLLACYLVFLYSVKSIHINFSSVENSYMISVIYCVFLFLICTLLRDRFASNRIVSHISKVSYTLYLTHGTFGLLIANLTADTLGLKGALLLGLSVTYLSTLALNRWIEAPMNRLGADLIDGIGAKRKPKFT